MSFKHGIAYIIFIDVLVNAVNFSLIKLGLAGSVGITLVLAPLLYAVLLGVGYTLRGKRILEDYKRNARDSPVSYTHLTLPTNREV